MGNDGVTGSWLMGAYGMAGYRLPSLDPCRQCRPGLPLGQPTVYYFPS